MYRRPLNSSAGYYRYVPKMNNDYSYPFGLADGMRKRGNGPLIILGRKSALDLLFDNTIAQGVGVPFDARCIDVEFKLKDNIHQMRPAVNFG